MYCLYRQAVKAKEYAGSFLRIYADAADPLGSIVNTGRQLRLENTQAVFDLDIQFNFIGHACIFI